MDTAVCNTPNFSRLLAKAEHYCALGEQSPHAVRTKLATWGATSGESTAIMDRLQADDFLNPLRYACAYASSKARHQRWGRRKIAFQLRNEELPADIVAQAIEAIDPEQYAASLMALAQQKSDTLPATLDPYARRARLTAYLTSRGYTPDEIAQALKETKLNIK